jgi:regulator of protease activity HflC (stomatin/prohibitin superfamily)
MAPRHEALEVGPPRKGYKWYRFVERHLPIIVIYLMVTTLVGFLIAPNVIVTVPTGQVGVLWKRFRGGTQLDPRLLKEEGMRVLLPWDKLFLYDLKLQTTTDTYNAISKDGVNLAATINIRFRLKHDAIPQLHQVIGPDYISHLVRPEIGNRAREIIAEYTAEEVYSTKRQEIQKRIRTHTEAMLGQSMVQRSVEESEYGEHYRIPLDAMLNLYDTLLLGLELPQSVVAAINRKVEQYYLVQEYAFRVDREKKESERKRIEAEGISAFQQIVSQGISDSYVRWRGIEATLQLAQSPNSKIVIIGSGKDGLPVILGNVDTPAVPPKAAGGQPSDNSEAATVRPMGASPPLLERMPASNLPTPPEQAPPTAVPRAPGAPPPATGPGAPPDNAPGAAPGKQSSAPAAEQRSSWTPTLSEIQAIVSRVIGSSEPASERAPNPPPSANAPAAHGNPPPPYGTAVPPGATQPPAPAVRPTAEHQR